MEIVELGPRLHLVRPVFGQVYVWRDGTELTMVDTGVPGSGDDLAAAFAELGYDRADLRRLVLTHGHEDHAGAAAAVAAWGDVEVLAHRADAPVVRGERPRPEPTLTPAERPLYDQVTAAIPTPPPCRVDTELTGGETLPFAGGAHVLPVPGHTGGSIALWLPDHAILVTGDVLANGPAGVMLGPFNTDRPRARASATLLSELPARTVCFGHGDPLTDPSSWHAFATRCRQSVPDPLG